MSPNQLSEPQKRALRVVWDMGVVSPRSFARAMWPDSDGWNHRGHRHDGKAGALGAAMWLNGAKFLTRLHGHQLVTRDRHSGRYSITTRGREALLSGRLPSEKAGL